MINSAKNGVIASAKRAIERIGGCRVYRNTLPHGVDCFVDISKRFGREGIRVVLDVGANIGQSAIDFSREFPQAEIYCFEPVESTYRELEAATHSLPRVHTFNVGMGKESGEAVIHVSAESTFSSIKVSLPEDHTESIQLETIADFATSHGLTTIDFLKIDTEGYDLEVLAGAIPYLEQQKVHFIFAECQPSAHSERFVSLSALEEFLNGFGYRLFGIYDQRFPEDNSNWLYFWNALFICGKLAAHGSSIE